MKKLKQFMLLFLIMVLPFSVMNAQTSKTKKTTKKSASKKTGSKKKSIPLKMPEEIKWYDGKETDFEAEAYKKKKPALLYIYLETNPECEAFFNRVLMDSAVIAFVDSNFVAYKLNMEYDWPNAMKYNIDGTPVVILLDKNTKPIDKVDSMMEPKEFLKILKKAVPKKQK